MLRAAIDGEGGESHLDVLTYVDLLALKSRRKGATPDCAAGGNNKRYVIVTHTVGERVHYPLPLAAESPPKPAAVASSAPARDQLIVPTHTEHSGAPAQALSRHYDAMLQEKVALAPKSPPLPFPLPPSRRHTLPTRERPLFYATGRGAGGVRAAPARIIARSFQDAPTV